MEVVKRKAFPSDFSTSSPEFFALRKKICRTFSHYNTLNHLLLKPVTRLRYPSSVALARFHEPFKTSG